MSGEDLVWSGLGIFGLVAAFKRWCAFADVVPTKRRAFQWRRVQGMPLNPGYVTIQQRASILSYIHGPMMHGKSLQQSSSCSSTQPASPETVTSPTKIRVCVLPASPAGAASSPVSPNQRTAKKKLASSLKHRAPEVSNLNAVDGVLLAAPRDVGQVLDPRSSSAWNRRVK